MATCIQCGREVPEQFAGAPCPACVHRAREAAQRRQFWEYVRHAFSSVTGVLIAVNVLVYLAMVLRGVSPTDPTVDQILRWGANFGPYTLDHQWWRLLTCMFLHIGIVHLLLNMWALLNVGPLAEVSLWPLEFSADVLHLRSVRQPRQSSVESGGHQRGSFGRHLRHHWRSHCHALLR